VHEHASRSCFRTANVIDATRLTRQRGLCGRSGPRVSIIGWQRLSLVDWQCWAAEETRHRRVGSWGGCCRVSIMRARRARASSALCVRLSAGSRRSARGESVDAVLAPVSSPRRGVSWGSRRASAEDSHLLHLRGGDDNDSDNDSDSDNSSDNNDPC
jgi:hypothetical protein